MTIMYVRCDEIYGCAVMRCPSFLLECIYYPSLRYQHLRCRFDPYGCHYVCHLAR